MFADALELGAAVPAVLVVVRLTRTQHEKAFLGPGPAESPVG
ncbi:hypothetical protein [Streptomyces sp. NPDC014995]